MATLSGRLAARSRAPRYRLNAALGAAPLGRRPKIFQRFDRLCRAAPNGADPGWATSCFRSPVAVHDVCQRWTHARIAILGSSVVEHQTGQLQATVEPRDRLLGEQAEGQKFQRRVVCSRLLRRFQQRSAAICSGVRPPQRPFPKTSGCLAACWSGATKQRPANPPRRQEPIHA